MTDHKRVISSIQEIERCLKEFVDVIVEATLTNDLCKRMTPNDDWESLKKESDMIDEMLIDIVNEEIQLEGQLYNSAYFGDNGL